VLHDDLDADPVDVVDVVDDPGVPDELRRYDEHLIDGGDLCDDDGSVAYYLSLPRSVADVLAEAALFGPGPEAITVLESLRGRSMTPDDALSVVELWDRQSRWLSVRCADATVAFAGARVETDRTRKRQQASRVLELGLVLDAGDAFLAQVVLPQARALATTLSATRAEVEAGRLSPYRARLICDKLRRLDADLAREIEAKVLTSAARIRTASLRDKLHRLILAAQDPVHAADEHRAGAADRRVEVDPEPSQPGLLGVHAYLPAQTAVAFRDAVAAKAAQFATADQKKAAAEDTFRPRTRDQLQADALAWFVLGPDATDPTRPARPRFLVQLTMSLPVLLALRDGCAELPGYGPIPAEVAREWAQDADWQRFVHDPVDGHLLDDGHRRYRPGARLRRFLRHRDRRDRFPGSNRPAQHCDADHLQPFTGNPDGGPTSAANLASTGRPGHLAKTHNGWSVDGGANTTLTYHSPTGRTHHSQPHDYRDPEHQPTPTTRPNPGPPPTPPTPTAMTTPSTPSTPRPDPGPPPF
jgi:hypothetical protein